MDIRPEMVDIRLAAGRPVGGQALKIQCPVHKQRLGVEDDRASMAVYPNNLHCFGCHFHVSRRYASLALLLGEWDGRGREDSERVREAVRRIKPRLHEFVSDHKKPEQMPVWVPPPIDPVTVEAFHQFLLSCMQGRLVNELYKKRGLSYESVVRYKLGHTGTHFSIPVLDVDNAWYTIRYRADEVYVDTNAADYAKYQGTRGRNDAVLYPVQVVRGLPQVKELWIVEGEYDAISSNQHGNVTLTITNGAGNIARIYEMVKAQFPTLDVRRWIVATDQDAAGEKAADDLLQVLYDAGEVGYRARWSGAKDLTEYYSGGGKREGIGFSI